MVKEYDVLVVGAGVGGAALTLALAQRSRLRILLIDRRSGPGNINRGDSLLPTVTRRLDAWGALAALYAAGARPIEKMQVFHHQDGLLFEAPLATRGSPYLVLPHPEIERALVETARATGRVEVRYRCRLVSLVEEAGRAVGATLAEESAGREEVAARLVVGADGSSSMVRESLGIPLVCTPYDHGYYIVEVERPARYQSAMRIELHPAGGVLVVPQGADRVGLGVLVRSHEQAIFRAGSFDEKIAAIARRSRLLDGCRGFAKGAHYYSLARGHAPRYVARGSALLGDAVHVTNPTAGQGMTMAIEDAAALARWVGPVLAGLAQPPAIDAALRSYERDRRPKNQRLLAWSHWASRFYALDGRLGDPMRHAVFRLGGSRVGRRIHQTIWSRMATRGGEAA